MLPTEFISKSVRRILSPLPCSSGLVPHTLLLPFSHHKGGYCFIENGCKRQEQQNRKNQSVENTDVSFVKGANERNEFFEKINKQ